jgi:hypothetical protein
MCDLLTRIKFFEECKVHKNVLEINGNRERSAFSSW